jgi:Arc/MetJ-type ribon-helix-helix transcriptional regulator
MKLSVSLPDEDVEFLDSFARSAGITSRSAVVHKAVRLLRASELGDSYEDAWREWDEAGAATDWDAAVGDGVTDAPR